MWVAEWFSLGADGLCRIKPSSLPFVGVRAFKVSENGNDVLKRQLVLQWEPATGAATLAAAGDAVPYGGAALTLRAEMLPDDSLAAWIFQLFFLSRFPASNPAFTSS